MTFKDLADKKVLGIPVLYIAGAAVTILAIVAWKMKATPDADTMGTTPEDGTAGADGESNAGGIAGMDDPYGDYNTNGTVVVQPVAPVTADPVEQTNDTWMRAAVDYLVDSKQATPGEAQSAISKYLDGEDLSYSEGVLRDAAISKLKLPPENIGKLGITASAPAQKQFSSFPGKHTVKGPNDNTYAKLAQLYYGTADANHVNRIVASNEAQSLGPSTTTFSPGTVVTIPVYTIVNYYKVTGKNGDNYFSGLSKKFGISAGAILGLNPGLTQPIPVGTTVRTS